MSNNQFFHMRFFPLVTEHMDTNLFHGANNLYSSSLFVANFLDAGDGTEWTLHACGFDMNTNTVMTTPPRVNTPPAYLQYPTVVDMATEYIRGSSLEETPLSSPSSINIKEEPAELVKPGAGFRRVRSTSPLTQFHFAAQSGTESMGSGDDDLPLPEGVKMPQSKAQSPRPRSQTSCLNDIVGTVKAWERVQLTTCIH